MLTINMIEKPHLFNPNDFPLTIDVAWREQLHQLHFGISLDKTNPHKANPDKMRIISVVSRCPTERNSLIQERLRFLASQQAPPLSSVRQE